MDRREFLKTLALTGAAVTMKWDGVMDIMAQNTSQAGGCDLVAVMGGEPAEMFRKAIAEFGGMGKFVKAGQKVVVKPNIECPDLFVCGPFCRRKYATSPIVPFNAGWR